MVEIIIVISPLSDMCGFIDCLNKEKLRPCSQAICLGKKYSFLLFYQIAAF